MLCSNRAFHPPKFLLVPGLGAPCLPLPVRSLGLSDTLQALKSGRLQALKSGRLQPDPIFPPDRPLLPPFLSLSHKQLLEAIAVCGVRVAVDFISQPVFRVVPG